MHVRCRSAIDSQAAVYIQYRSAACSHEKVFDAAIDHAIVDIVAGLDIWPSDHLQAIAVVYGVYLVAVMLAPST